MGTLVGTSVMSQGAEEISIASSEPSIFCKASMRLFGGATAEGLPNTPQNMAALRLLVKIAKGEGNIINGQLVSVHGDLGVPKGTDESLLKMVQERLELKEGDRLEALKEFQKNKGLRADKNLGELTAQHLLKALEEKNMIKLGWVGCNPNS